jgi:hypothetical protein
MATLPDTPVNTALTLGAVAAMGLIAYTQKLRNKIEVQVHDNYRHAKVVDAGLMPEAPVTLHPEKSANRSA